MQPDLQKKKCEGWGRVVFGAGAGAGGDCLLTFPQPATLVKQIN